MRLRQVLKNVCFLQHCLCCTLCLTSIEENILHVGDEDAEFGSCVDSLGCPDVLKHVKCSPGLANPSFNIPVHASLFILNAFQVDKGFHLLNGLSTDFDWCIGSGVNVH